MTHSFAVVPVDPGAVVTVAELGCGWLQAKNGRLPSGYRWECRCGAKGASHEEHQRAVEFGSQHLSIMEER